MKLSNFGENHWAAAIILTDSLPRSLFWGKLGSHPPTPPDMPSEACPCSGGNTSWKLFTKVPWCLEVSAARIDLFKKKSICRVIIYSQWCYQFCVYIIIYIVIYILHHIVYAIYVIFYKHLETPVQGHWSTRNGGSFKVLAGLVAPISTPWFTEDQTMHCNPCMDECYHR